MENTTTAEPVREFVENQPYYAEIIDQGFRDIKGQEVFILTAHIQGKVSNPNNPESNLTPMPKYTEIEILNFFPTDNAEQFDWRVNDLRRLGFDGDDLTQLDPGHENHVSLVGKKTLVKCQIKEKDGKERTYWNLMFQGKKSEPLSADRLSKLSKKLGKPYQSALKRLADRAKEKTPF